MSVLSEVGGCCSRGATILSLFALVEFFKQMTENLRLKPKPPSSTDGANSSKGYGRRWIKLVRNKGFSVYCQQDESFKHGLAGLEESRSCVKPAFWSGAAHATNDTASEGNGLEASFREQERASTAS